MNKRLKQINENNFEIISFGRKNKIKGMLLLMYHLKL